MEGDFAVLKKMLIKHKLREIDMENIWASISKNAFDGCENLRRIKLPKYIVSIGYMSFAYCSGLESIEFPSTLSRIDIGAFWMCSSLKSVVFNRRLEYMGGDCFHYCDNLKEIHCMGTVPAQCEYSSFKGLHENSILYVPTGCKKTYAYANGWLHFENIKEEEVEKSYLLDVNMYGKGSAQCKGYWFDIYPNSNYTLEFEKGEVAVFNIFPDAYFSENYIEKILLDKIDIISQLINENELFLKIDKDSKLDIYIKEKMPVSNEVIMDEHVKVTTNSDCIIVENVEAGEDICIHSMSGNLVASKKSDGDRCNIRVASEQIYIVQIGTKIFKVKL